MKTNIGLLVGGLVLLLGSTASAATLCGTVSSPNDGTVGFNQAFNGSGGGTASVSGGAGTITCGSFTVPAGFTLVSITVQTTDDAQHSVDSNSQVTWAWSYTSGAALTPTPGGTFSETGNSSFGFNPCAGSGTLVCDGSATFLLNSPVAGVGGGTPTGTFSFMVTPSVTGPSGDGLAAGGGDSASVVITFNYVPTTSVPEPASLLLIGSGLIGVGAFARRKRQR